MDMLDRLDAENWERYAQPSWNAKGEVPDALRALADPADLDRCRAYHRLLYALGNDHAGTYFPVVLPAIAFLGEILRGSALVARLRTLDVLIDIIGSFQPETGHEEVETARGRRSLKDVVNEAIKGLREQVENLCRAPGSDEEATLASELLALLDE